MKRLVSSMSGLGQAMTIALLQLSLVLAVGALSATPLGQSALPTAVVAAFVATAIGGLLVAVIARAPAEIAGTASSVTVIYAALAADLLARAGPQASLSETWAALSLAVALAGVLVALAGYARLAGAIKFMPTPVSAGFVTGLGLLVSWSQIGPLLGLEGPLSSYRWSDALEQAKPASAVVGVVTAFVMWGWRRVTRRGQPALMALGVGTAVYYTISWTYGPRVLGPTLGTIAPTETAPATVAAVWSYIDPGWLASTAFVVAPYAAFLAFQIIMNAAVTAASVAAIIGTRSDINRTLKTQGWTNVLCGLLGALPVTTIASVSLPAARMNGVTPMVAAASCVILFIAVLTAGELLARLPVAVLAGILIIGGIAMVDRWALGLIGTLRRGSAGRVQVMWNLAIVAAVTAVFFFGSVPLALFVGAVLAMVMLAVGLSEATVFESSGGTAFASTRAWSAEQVQWLAGERRRIAVFRPRGSLFFGTADQLAMGLEGVEPHVGFVVLDLARVTTIDATGCQIVAASAKKLESRGVTALLAGIAPDGARAREWTALGLTQPDPRTHWLGDLDHALERIELTLLGEKGPMPGAHAADFADTPLTRGLSEAELAELKRHMTTVDVPAGPLFRRGDPGASMFVVDSGFVEIRIGSDAAAQSTRLAAFGAGSIFGEIAMLNNAEARTADAVCTEPTRLYEFTRESLLALRDRSPALYTCIIENLNRHLATRLVVATATVQGRR